MILLIDDFLADGNAAFGLFDIVEQTGCKVAGIEDLFTNELHIPTHRMEHLVNVSFPRHFSEGLYNQTEGVS